MDSTVDFESDMYVEQARGDTTSPIEVPRKKTKRQIAKKKRYARLAGSSS